MDGYLETYLVKVHSASTMAESLQITVQYLFLNYAARVITTVAVIELC